MNIDAKHILVLGLASIGALFAAPSLAGPPQAFVSGSSNIILMNGASMSVGLEVGASAGAMFDGFGVGSFLVTPFLLNPLDTNTAEIGVLSVDVGVPVAAPINSSFTAAAATTLTNATILSDQVSLIRAGMTGSEGQSGTTSRGSSSQSYVSSSASIVLMNGASMSTGIEVGAPAGAIFDGGGVGSYFATPLLGAALDTNTAVISFLSIDAGVPVAAPANANASFRAAAATKLVNATTLSDQVSIIRAGTDTSGLE